MAASLALFWKVNWRVAWTWTQQKRSWRVDKTVREEKRLSEPDQPSLNSNARLEKFRIPPKQSMNNFNLISVFFLRREKKRNLNCKNSICYGNERKRIQIVDMEQRLGLFGFVYDVRSMVVSLFKSLVMIRRAQHNFGENFRSLKWPLNKALIKKPIIEKFENLMKR